MSKELVISSNRHETKVAILEDDQLVEVYFQRANEYSLAGSVHKGRVTRVLPGMQSAFVDLGLDRDTFLYVSDFFEENEDYDRIEGGPNPTPSTQTRPERGERNDRSERNDRGERGERRDRPERGERPPLPAPVVEEAVPAAVETQPEVTGVSQNGDAAPRPAGEDGDRDRRGRRSRRRRRGSRGFPDSKYASAADTREDTTGPTEGSESEVEDAPGPRFGLQDDMRIVLPGESLAKYKAPRRETPVEPAIVGDDDNGVPPGLSAIPDENPEEQPPVNAMPDAPVHEHAHVAGAATAPESIPHPKPLQEETEIEEAASDTAIEEAANEKEIAGETESQNTSDAAQSGDGDDDPEIRALILDSDGDVIEPSGEGETPALEGEQKSQSASVREQGGGRYLQRGRRMRGRRSRGPQSGEQPAPFREPRPESRPEPRPEVRSEPRAEAPPEHRSSTRPERAPMPSITDLLKEGQEILVQIAKEPLGQKGARITSHIALPGRFVVYMPTLDHMGVSRKIASDDERLRLKKILQKHRIGVPGGYIIRTAGEGKTEDEISSDMLFLANLWLDIRQKAEKRPAPLLLHHDLDIVQRILRDQVNDNFKSMWVDNEEMYESILRFLQRFQPTMVSRVKLYTRPAPIFDAFNVTNELEKALRPKVWLKSGGYIVINQTEALVAIDINTGKYVGKSNRLEDTIVKTNTEAVKEIVRQIRLRDLGGIIVIDFIDMDERKNRQKVMQVLEDAMRSDRAPNKILQFNDFGLVAITRKRVKQSLERTLCAPCPYCEGAGYVKSVQTIIGEILQEAQKIARAVEGSNNVMLRVHPDVAKLLKSNENHYLEELEEILKRPVLVTSDAAIHHEKFDLA